MGRFPSTATSTNSLWLKTLPVAGHLTLPYGTFCEEVALTAYDDSFQSSLLCRKQTASRGADLPGKIGAAQVSPRQGLSYQEINSWFALR